MSIIFYFCYYYYLLLLFNINNNDYYHYYYNKVILQGTVKGIKDEVYRRRVGKTKLKSAQG